MTDITQFIKIVQQYVEMGADVEKAHELAERAFTFVSKQDKAQPKKKPVKPVKSEPVQHKHFLGKKETVKIQGDYDVENDTDDEKE